LCAVRVEESVIEGIDSLLTPYQKPDTPGASVAVLSHGNVIFKKAYGFANVDRSTPASPGTNYRLASVTKQFTATAVLMLIDRGKLKLDSRLTEVLPGVPTYARGITIRHLLTHTSGLVDFEDLIPDSQTVQVLDKDVLMLLSRIDSVYFPPGAKYRYSNSGYALLALAVEAVSGQSFAKFLKQQIFEPLVWITRLRSKKVYLPSKAGPTVIREQKQDLSGPIRVLRAQSSVMAGSIPPSRPLQVGPGALQQSLAPSWAPEAILYAGDPE